MGLALLSRLARQPSLPLATRTRYQDYIAAQHATFAAHCQDAATGLYKHGYSAVTQQHSCCFWGRANGWVMMAHAEVAQALAEPPHAALPAVLAVWRRQAAGLAAVLPPAGSGSDQRLHQVLDAPTTYHETSASAMACYSLAVGLQRGFLPRAQFDAPLRSLYAGVAGALDAAGQVQGICEGTPIEVSTAMYEARRTVYNISSPGLGAVFRCAMAFEEYTSHAQ